jgi:hypothetical protein
MMLAGYTPQDIISLIDRGTLAQHILPTGMDILSVLQMHGEAIPDMPPRGQRMGSPKRFEDGLDRRLGGDRARLHSEYPTRLVLRNRPAGGAGDQYQSVCLRRARGSPNLVWQRPAR